MSEHPLRPIFEPRSVGVIGASADPRKRGHQVVAALRRSGYGGTIVPVHPRGGQLLGLSVERAVADAPETPELVYVATPAHTVPDVVRECGEAGVKGAVVPAVGFGESGEEGAELQRRLVDAARETGVRVVGPNTSGLLNTHIGLHMVGGEPLRPGGLAIVSQSGNVALDLMTSALERPLGVSIYVGPGNECDVGFHEILDFLVDHGPTRAIVMYVEGVANGRALFDVASRARGRKPIVVLKGGRSAAGGRAARSHTGAIAGSRRVFSAAAEQCGMIEVGGSDEILPVGEALALQPRPDRARADGAGYVVISDGGGHGTIAADRFTDHGIPLARLAPATSEALERLFGPAANAANPVDAAGAPDRAPSVLAEAVRIAAKDPACAGILLIGLFGGYAIRFAESLLDEELEAARALSTAAGPGVPLVVHSLYAARRPEPLQRLLEAGVPVHGSLEIAAACCAALWRSASPAGSQITSPVVARSEGADDGAWLSEVEARELVAGRGVPVAPGTLCREEAEVRVAVREGEGPWAVKAVSAALPHKTEAGAVELGVSGVEEVVRAYAECRAAAVNAVGPDAVVGVLISEMLPTPIAELLIGAKHDASFGPVLTVGFGGVAAELAPDVAVRLLPLDGSDVDGMVAELERSALLTGHRGRAGIDMQALRRVALAVGACLEDPWVAEVELNPVFAYENEVIAVDALARRAAGTRV